MNIPKAILYLCVGTLSLTSSSEATSNDKAEGEPLAGHSSHGEAFNEGPRQAAYLMGSTGNVHFPISTKNPTVQAFFDQGIGQLHGFWYFEAERSFRHAAAMEPECAMTYWGIAMANFNNAKRAKEFTQEAVNRKESASPREQLWIETLEHYYLDNKKKDEKTRSRRLVRDLEEIIYQYPDDSEAKAFLAVRVWQNERKGLPISSHQAVESLLQDVFASNPMHPAHHFRIHLWDREKPERALASAARCGQTSRGIAHMWHMPGHIYSRLHRYTDAVWQQEASARVDHAHMMRDRVLPDQIHNFAHNNEWLIRNLNYLGRVTEAVDLAKNMIELPQHPTYNHLGKRGSSSNYGRLRLVETLIQYEQWDQLIDLAESPYLAQSEVIQAELIRQKALATAWYQKGNMEKVKEVRASLVSLRVSEKQRRSEAIDNAEEEAINASKNDKEVNEAMEKAMTGFKNPLRLLRESIQLTDLYLALLEENHDTAKELVKKVKGVNKVDLAQIYHALGDDEEALKQLEDAIKNIPGQVHPHARAAELFLALDKKEKATDTFESLRKIAGALDRDVPIAQRMDKLAADLGYNSDWVIPFETADDVGQRPSLDSLGPFRWAPYEAPSWELPDAKGESVSSLEFEKKPTLLVFYLGFGCSHCVRQLAVIEPETDKFKELGIKIAAVSTETIEELAASNKASEILGSLSFPLMADPQLRVFKQFRAYDDFEQTPLHGTFLIDGEGKVRWQDISYEPFTDIEFLLKESKRLLSQPKATDLAGGIE